MSANSSGYAVVLTTTGSEQEAQELSKKLVEARLAACVQIQSITSHFMWKGNASTEAEQLLLLKTRATLFPAIQAFIREHHSYEVPEIVMVPITAGFAGYLEWIEAETDA
jgi:periplasmic divalent cation tolerance protein